MFTIKQFDQCVTSRDRKFSGVGFALGGRCGSLAVGAKKTELAPEAGSEEAARTDPVFNGILTL